MEKKTLGEVLQRKFVKGPCESSNFLYFCTLSHFRNPEPEFPSDNNPNFFDAFSFPGSPQFSPVGVGYTTAYNYNAQGLPVSYNGQVTVDGQVFTVDPNQQVIRNTEEIDLGKSFAPARLMKLVVRAYADSASVPIRG